MILLHAFAAARFRPAVKFLAKRFGMTSRIRGSFYSARYCFSAGMFGARLHAGFIGRRAIDGRHGDIVETQVDSELRAMMNHVVHDHGAQDANARHSENSFPAVEKTPR